MENQVKLLPLYISDRKTKDGKNSFKVYKTRSNTGVWADVKFTEEAGKPKPYFELGKEEFKKGYVVINVVSYNTAKKTGVYGVDSNGAQRWEIWVSKFEIATEIKQKAFKKHIEDLQIEFKKTQNAVFEEFCMIDPTDITTEESPF